MERLFVSQPERLYAAILLCLKTCLKCTSELERIVNEDPGELQPFLKIAHVLHKFHPDKIKDWRVLYNKGVRTALFGHRDRAACWSGFKGVFIFLYYNGASSAELLDLGSTALGKNEMLFLLRESRYGHRDAIPEEFNGFITDNTLAPPPDDRYFHVLRAYLADIRAPVSSKFVKILIDAYAGQASASGTAQMAEVSIITDCVFLLVKKARMFLGPLRPIFKHMIDDGHAYDVVGIARKLRYFKKTDLLQAFYNNLHKNYAAFFPRIFRDMKKLSILDFIASNSHTNELFEELSKYTPAQKDVNKCRWFIKRIVWTKLRWMSLDNRFLRHAATGRSWAALGSCAEPLLYLSLFLGWDVQLGTVHTPMRAILESIISNQVPEQTASTQGHLLHILCDLKEIKHLGLDITRVVGAIQALFKFNGAVAAECYLLAKTLNFDNLMIDTSVLAIISVLVTAQDFHKLNRLYERAVRAGCGPSVMANFKPHSMHLQMKPLIFESKSQVYAEKKSAEHLKRNKIAIVLPRRAGTVEDAPPPKPSPAFIINLPSHLRRIEDELKVIADSDESSDIFVIENSINAESVHTGKAASHNISHSGLKDKPSRGPLIADLKTGLDNPGKTSAKNGMGSNYAARGLRHPLPMAKETPADSQLQTSRVSEVSKEEGKSTVPNIEQVKKGAAAIMSQFKRRESVVIDSRLNFANIQPKKQAWMPISRPEAKAEQKMPASSCDIPTPSKPCATNWRTFTTDITSNAFLDGFLGLSLALPAAVAQIPTKFDSYDDYFRVFNPLRLHEVRYAITQDLKDGTPLYSCLVDSVTPQLHIQCDMSAISEYDILFFTKDASTISADLRAMVSRIKCAQAFNGARGCFIGLVTALQIEKMEVRDGKYLAVFTILTSRPSLAIARGDTLFFKLISPGSTDLREYLALLGIRRSPILKYILSPSLIPISEDRAVLPVHSAVIKRPKRWETTGQESKITNLGKVELSSPLGNPTSNGLCGHLNEAQKSALSAALESRDSFVLIQGPPGTGKTELILAIITGLLKKPLAKILVCTPSNVAIDEIVQRSSRIQDLVPFLLRIGCSTHPKVLRFTVDFKIAQRQKAFNEDKAYARARIISEAKVFCSTLSSCAAHAMSGLEFSYLIIDEACQATELSALIPLRYNPRRTILIGDPKQLPPTVLSQNQALEYSLFERLHMYCPLRFLNVQYRMHSAICSVASGLFYRNKLISSEQVASRNLDSIKRTPGAPHLSTASPSTAFVHISNGQELLDGLRSYYNPCEGKIAIQIKNHLRNVYGKSLSICILSPYKAQVSKMKKQDKQNSDICTIDASQGREADVVIISTVRRTGLGFVCDFRRVNVAVTRAKLCVIILGDKACLEKSKIWSKIIDLVSVGNYYDDKNIGRLLKKL